MLGILYLLTTIGLGILLICHLCPGLKGIMQAVAGLLLGILLAMWLPFLAAFFLQFTPAAQYLALLAAGIGLIVFGQRPARRTAEGGRYQALRKPGSVLYVLSSAVRRSPSAVIWPSLAILVPSGLAAYLYYTHMLLPGPGGLYVGQSTFGDLPLHLSMITNLAYTHHFPPQYAIYSGHPLGYPFLINALSATLVQLGWELRASLIVPSLLLFLTLNAGLYSLALRLLHRHAAAWLATWLFVFNGGWGIIYFLDGLRRNPDNFWRIFSAFYQVPTNLQEKNIYWVNALCDIFVPQRTSLVGMAAGITVSYLLVLGLQAKGAGMDIRRGYFRTAGLLVGLLPLVHTHSFLICCILTSGWSLALWPGRVRAAHQGYWANWGAFAAPAALLALPQIVGWTLPQSLGHSYVRFHWDWINEQDNWLWFWLKNVGWPFLLVLPAWLHARTFLRRLYLPALALFGLAEFVLFQPMYYDNIKMFLYWYLWTVLLVADFLVSLYRRVRPLRGGRLVVVVLIISCFVSSTPSIARELRSRMFLYSSTDLQAASYLRQHAPLDAIFLTSTLHSHPVPCLAGREAVLVFPSILWSHGFKDYEVRQRDVAAMYKDVRSFEQLRKIYGVTFVYIGPAEQTEFRPTIEQYLRTHYRRAFTAADNSVRIYRLDANRVLPTYNE